MMKRSMILLSLLFLTLLMIGCDRGGEQQNVPSDTTSSLDIDTTYSTDYYADAPEVESGVTLPILAVFMADSSFVRSISNVLNLTPEEVDSLRQVSFAASSEMYGRPEREMDYDEFTGMARTARTDAEETIVRILGQERGEELIDLIRIRWNQGLGGESYTSANGIDSMGSGMTGDSAGMMGDSSMGSSATGRNGVSIDGAPSDTRIVINIPSYRMDLFDDGNLTASYQVAIGYPEFPLPTGMRRANQIIFNPTWTPPAESWVEGSKTAKAGKTIPAGSKDNPLGIAKIPIGLPSLIHAGKPESRIGTFGSHGCVGLTDTQMKSFLVALGKATGTTVTDSTIAAYGKNRSKTVNLSLASPLPVELRYETITVENGALVIYRDVYDYNTNSEQNLKRVLGRYGISLASLDQAKQKEIMDGLKKMALDAQSQSDDEDRTGGDTAASKHDKTTITRTMKGEKMVTIQIPALQGKGYPSMKQVEKGVAAK